MYNADMVLYFLDYLLVREKYPPPGAGRIDGNATISYNILPFVQSFPSLVGHLEEPLKKAGKDFRQASWEAGTSPPQ